MKGNPLAVHSGHIVIGLLALFSLNHRTSAQTLLPTSFGLTESVVNKPKTVGELKKVSLNGLRPTQVLKNGNPIADEGLVEGQDWVKFGENDSIKAKALLDILNALPEQKKSDTLRASITATGDFKGVLGSQSGGTVGTGSLGVRFEHRLFTFSGQVSLASANDTLKKDYGHSMLIPKSGQASGLAELLFYPLELCGDQAKPFSCTFISSPTLQHGL